VKQLRVDSSLDRVVETFIHESRTHAQLHRHANIVRLYGVCIDESSGMYWLVVEWMTRSLFRHLHGQTARARTWPAALAISLDCARALRHLHQQSPPIVHGDISSANFLVHPDGTIKLGERGRRQQRGSDRIASHRIVSIVRSLSDASLTSSCSVLVRV
jgi:interleukin-1 receptor-associated kinase 1